MKRSVFTTEFARENGSSIFFNTLNGALALARPEVPENELGEGGFLVSDSLDEEERLAARFLEDMNQTSFLTLCIAPTMACNLRCVYCYEDQEPVRMSSEVEEGIMRFVRRRFARYGFENLEILWYGGEPLLEIERMESLSSKMMTWCSENDVTYHASITTNATLVDKDIAARMARMGITSAMPTLDGCKPQHDLRRSKANAAGSYEETLTGIKAMASAGIEVGVNHNLGWDTVEDYRALRTELEHEPNCALYASHLRNYGDWCKGCGEGCSCPTSTLRAGSVSTGPQLMSREAYAKQLFDFYRESNPSAGAIAESLRSKRSFCHGKMASYFVIDPEGYVCRCDGHMRDPRYRLFNVLDSDCPLEWPETQTLYERNPRCKGCAIMPLCLGDCDWEWEMFEENCSALKYTLEDYVRLLVSKIGIELGEGETFLQLIAPADIDTRYATPFSPFTGDGVMG